MAVKTKNRWIFFLLLICVCQRHRCLCIIQTILHVCTHQRAMAVDPALLVVGAIVDKQGDGDTNPVRAKVRYFYWLLHARHLHEIFFFVFHCSGHWCRCVRISCTAHVIRYHSRRPNRPWSCRISNEFPPAITSFNELNQMPKAAKAPTTKTVLQSSNAFSKEGTKAIWEHRATGAASRAWSWQRRVPNLGAAAQASYVVSVA